MWFETSLSIPASRTKLAPALTRLKISRGVMTHVVVEAHPGCHCEAGVRILYQNHQIYPLNPGEWIRLDAIPRDFETREELFNPPYYLVIEGYNDDAVNTHEYLFGFGILPPEALPEYREAEGLIKRIARILGVK